MPSSPALARDQAAITWREPSVRRRHPSAFWKTAPARKVLACVTDQRSRRRACAVSNQAIHAWVMSLVRQTWPDSTQRARIAADLAPEVPIWWLGPAEADRLIANALLERSRRVRQARPPRRIVATPVPGPAWISLSAEAVAGSYAIPGN